MPNREQDLILLLDENPSFMKIEYMKIHLLQYMHTYNTTRYNYQPTPDMARDRQDEIAMDTIDLLEARLERIILLLSGMEPPEGEGELRKYVVAREGEGMKNGNNLKEENVRARLVRLEKGLVKVVGSNRVLGELMGVCMKLIFPALSKKNQKNTYILGFLGRKGIGGVGGKRLMVMLWSLDTAYPDLLHNDKNYTDPSDAALSPGERLAIISACATSYPTTASRLNSIKDVPIPPVESSLALIALQPRINRLEQLQEEQERELSELRLRSARVLKRWYEVGVLAGGECWVEWEGRVMGVEKRVKRVERWRERERKEKEALMS